MKKNILHLKQVKHFLKVTNIAFLTFSLIVAPSTFAQGSGAPTPLAAGIGGAIQQFTLQAVGAMANQGPIVPQQVAKVPAKLFPRQCQVLPARTNLPTNACEGQLTVATSANDFMGRIQATQMMGQSSTLANMAKGKILSIDQLINLDSNNPNTTDGLACLHREAKELQDEFVKKQQELTALIGRIDMMNKAFIEQNEARISQMADNAYLLYGSNFKGKANIAHLKFKDSFTAGCQEIIGLEALNGATGGLQGLNDNVLVRTSQAASVYQRNQPDYERQIKDQVTELLNDFQEYGITSYNPQAGFSPKRGQNKFLAMDDVINRELEKLNKKYQTYQSIISDYNINGASLPALDHKFESELDRLSQNASTVFLQRAVDDCMTGRDRRGVALSTEQIIQNLNYIPTNNSGSTLESYTTSLRTILDSDRTMQEKIEEIRLLDQRIGGNVQIEMHHFDGSNGSVTPYQLYQNTLTICEAQITQPGEGGELSLQEKVEETQKLINEIKADKNRFVRNIDNYILDEVINCSGSKLPAGRCSVANAAGMLDPAGDNFCIAHASECSTQLKSCHKEAEDTIKVKKDQSAILAEEYNNNFVNMMAQQNQLAQQVSQRVLGLAQLVNDMIPGAAWEFQGDPIALVPEKPELVAELGIHLRGGGNFESLDQLKTRIADLQALLQDQAGKVEREVSDYIALQEDNMEQAKEDWQELAEKCDKQIAEARQRQNEMMAQQGQAIGEANGFCTEYNRAIAQPSCGRVSALAGASVESSGHLVGGAHRNAQAIESDFCPDGNSSQDIAQADDAIEDIIDEDKQLENLAKACEDNDPDDFKRESLNNLKNNLPNDLKPHRSNIEKYVKGETDELPAGIQSTDSFVSSHIEPLREAFEEASKTNLSDEFSDEGIRSFISNLSTDRFEKYFGDSDLEESLKNVFNTSEEDLDDSLEDLNSNFCLKVKIQVLVEAGANGEVAEDQIDALLTRAADRLEEGKDFNNEIETVARGIASVDRSGRSQLRAPVTSNSGRIGQQLASVPCTNLAGQGNMNAGRMNPMQQREQNLLGGDTGGLIYSGLNQ